jgi:AcrR family transcriptional regulator
VDVPAGSPGFFIDPAPAERLTVPQTRPKHERNLWGYPGYLTTPATVPRQGDPARLTMRLHHLGGLFDRHPDELAAQDRVLLAALECFVERGYHGTTIRQIATRAGVSAPGLYHYFPSKLALLERLIDDTMDDLIATTETALAAAGADPVERFTAVVEAHVRFHCERPEESFVGNTEVRSLSAPALRRTLGKRDRQQRMFDDVVEPGVAAGVFNVGDAGLASRAIVTMCTGVANWYQRSGPLPPEQIVQGYRDLTLNALGYTGRRAERRGTRPGPSTPGGSSLKVVGGSSPDAPEAGGSGLTRRD